MEKHQRQHLAIFTPPFLDLILEGRKTIEGRFSKVRCAPFGVVEECDVVLMKESGGQVLGSFIVAKVESFECLTPEKLRELGNRYSEPLCADADPQYWQRRQASKYATLMHVVKPTRFERPFPFPKKDRRGWVVLSDDTGSQLPLFPKEGDGIEIEREKAKKYDPLRSRCSEGLHTFFRTSLFNGNGYPRCRHCGADCVNWKLMHRKDASLVNSAIAELRNEYWRNSWFERHIDERAENHALRKGKQLLREHVANRIRKSVGPVEPYRDGFQTPYTSNVAFYAQHAVAACCRKCIEVWHGIPKGRELTNQEIHYLAELAMRYVDTVMPNLREEGVYVPPIKKPQQRKE
jgi:predicted transcriptional regulator